MIPAQETIVGEAIGMLKEPLRRLAAFLGFIRPGEPATKALGRKGEDAAAEHLKRSGYRVLERNVLVPMGEADIVAEAPDGRTMVIIEVKTRRRTPGQPARSAATPPEASVTAHKRRKLVAIAKHLSHANHWHDRPVRIDVVAVEFTDGQPTPVLRHHTGVR